jgi:PST family polysaccharide transporter
VTENDGVKPESLEVALWLRVLPTPIQRRFGGRAGLQAVARNTAWLVTDRLSRLGIGLIVGVLVTRHLGPTQLGVLSFATALAGLGSFVATLGLEAIVVRDLVRYPDERNEILGTAFAIRIGAGLVACFAALGAALILRPGEPLIPMMVAITSAALIIQSADVIDFWFQSQVRARNPVIARNVAFLIACGIRLALVRMRAPVIAFAWATLAETVLAAIGLFVAYHVSGERNGRWVIRRIWVVRLFRDSWPIFLSSLAIGAYMRLDMLMLGSMVGDAAVGIYSAATRVSEVWYFVPTVIASSVTPALILARQSDTDLYYRRLSMLLNLFAGIALLIAVPVTFLAGPLVHLLFGAQYAAAGPVLALHIWAALFVFLGVGQNCWVVAEGLMILALPRTIIGAALNILLNVLLIPGFGPLGAAIATVIAYGVSAVLLNAFDPRTRRIFTMQWRAMFLCDLYTKRRA